MESLDINRIQEALKRITGYGEIRIETYEGLSMLMRNGKSENVNSVRELGGSVRVLFPGHGWGFASFNKISHIDKAVQDAIDASRTIVPEEPIVLADVEPIIVEIADKLIDDFRNHSLEEKHKLLKGFDEKVAGRDKRIIERVFRYSEGFGRRRNQTHPGPSPRQSPSDRLPAVAGLPPKTRNNGRA